MDLGINGKVAVVAAASQGLGRACAQALANEGARVAILSRRPEELEKVAKEIGAALPVASSGSAITVAGGGSLSRPFVTRSFSVTPAAELTPNPITSNPSTASVRPLWHP